MIEEIEIMLNRYVSWLRDKTNLRQIGDWVEITTPYLDRHNDYLQIYAKRENGGFLLTDDGYIIDDLEQSGCKLDTDKRRKLLTVTLNGFGVQLKDHALQVHASMENFALRKHSLIQAMLSVNDMFYLASPMVASLFYEDVAGWLDIHDIRYSPKIKFTGKTGYDHLFDFVIPKSRDQPERIIQTINRPNRNAAQALVMAWIDTRDARPLNSHAYAFLNDADQNVTSTVFDALRSYEVHPVLWSQRESVKSELDA